MPDLITRELDLPVAPGAVWQAITQPEWLESWLAETVSIDLHPGGDARFVVDGEAREGWVEDVRPPGDARSGVLTFWWQADGEPASRVSLQITPTAGGTRLRVMEARPLEVLDLVGIPMRDSGHGSRGPSLVAA
jgi:uncharacterized protein YndB with AHSA1/START domain